MLTYLKLRFTWRECDFQNLLSFVVWVFKIISINVDVNTEDSVPINIFCYVSAVLAFYSYILSAVYYLSVIYPVDKNAATLLMVVSFCGFACIGGLKYIYITLFRHRLIEVIEEYKQLDSQWDPNSRHCRRAEVSVRMIKKRCVICFLGLAVNSVIYAIKPIFLEGRHLPFDEAFHIGLQPKYETPYYEIGYFILVIGAYMTTIAPTAVTTGYVFFVGYLEAHYLALGEDFVNLWEDTTEEVNKKTSAASQDVIHSTLEKLLANLISKHVGLLKLVRMSNKLFRIMILFEFGITILSLCAVLLGGVENLLAGLFYAMTQLFLNCFLGQLLINSGVFFEKCVYDCGWEKFDNSNKRSVGLVLQMSQEVPQLTAGGISTLCLESFMSILKSVYSMYATLSSK